MNALPLWASIPAALLLCIGSLLTLIGALGLLRLPNFYARMHGPALGNTMGTGCLLLSSMLVFSVLMERPILHELLIGVFIILTAPVTTMLLTRASLFQDHRNDSGEKQTTGDESAAP